MANKQNVVTIYRVQRDSPRGHCDQRALKARQVVVAGACPLSQSKLVHAAVCSTALVLQTLVSNEIQEARAIAYLFQIFITYIPNIFLIPFFKCVAKK